MIGWETPPRPRILVARAGLVMGCGSRIWRASLRRQPPRLKSGATQQFSKRRATIGLRLGVIHGSALYQM